jgi:hypothetical protein
VALERLTSRERRASIERRRSKDWRGYVSLLPSWMGDRAEMSCAQCKRGMQYPWHCQHTKDLRYESKLSREMLKGSFSLSRLRWFDDVVDVFDLECQKVGFSWGGEGCRKC